MNRFTACLTLIACCFAFSPDSAGAHVQDFAIEGKGVQISTSKGPSKAKFKFKSEKNLSIVPLHDPVAVGASVLVRGTGSFGLDAGRTAGVDLDPTKWKALGNPAGSKGYKYTDKTGSRGGITKVQYKLGKLQIQAKGVSWGWSPAGPQDEVWVHFTIENETYCAMFGGTVSKNEAGSYKAKSAPSPGACPALVCGNSVVELGEDCDDGNLDETDGCNIDCTTGTCENPAFTSTFEGIHAVVFDAAVYGCSAGICHGGAPGDPAGGQGGLNLIDAPTAYEALMGPDGTGADSVAFGVPRVVPGEPTESLLYQKLAALTLGHPLTYGSAMPSGGGTPLTTQHLEAIEKWIRGGAPEDLVVEGTAGLLGSCLPDPDPLTIPLPDPPGAGIGAQIQQTPWDLPSQFENEICMATYYDLTVTGLVPASAKIECPASMRSKVCDNDDTIACTSDADCGGGTCVTYEVCQLDPATTCASNADCGGDPCVVNNPHNPSNECFAYHRLTLLQDPQSHHSFVRNYLGQALTTDPAWGDWTYKFQDQADPDQGAMCDPLDVDPATGFNANCSSDVVEAVACLGFGPADMSQGGGGLISSGEAPTFTGSQEPYFDNELADGVYSILPMQATVVWNSHAFNLTNGDSTMSQYLNITFAEPADQLYPARGINGIQSIFVQNVPPFETREYCRSYTLPQGANLFSLASHTHRHGVLWRTWDAPNTQCVPGEPACVPDEGRTPIYLSTEYNDPLQLKIDPPVVYDSANDEDRTFLFCAVFDNGATPTSPAVKRQSTSPAPPLIFGVPVGPGGPCDDTEVQCMDGPNKGQLCMGDDLNCPGSECDACPVRGGVTTEDEMFILFGGYFVP